MSAYLLVAIKAHDLSWVDAYVASVPAIVHRHGGAYVIVSDSLKRYEGDAPDPDQIVLFTFPSMEAISGFISDPDYGPYKAARLAGSSSDMFAFTSRAD